MKFDKTLTQIKNNFVTEPLRQSILPYKYWKKYIKKNKEVMNPSEIIITLDQQCREAEQIFTRELHSRLYTKTSLFGCCNKEIYPYDISEELIQFSEINRIALYKICKKLQKNGALNLMNYYSKADFKFIQSHELMFLKMQIEPYHECQICMEEANNYIILDCGHYMCISCILKMTNTENLKATPYNKVSIGIHRFQNCPFCRKKNPLKQLDKYHFYPAVPK